MKLHYMGPGSYQELLNHICKAGNNVMSGVYMAGVMPVVRI